LPEDADAKRVPWWWAFEDFAEKLQMSVPALLAWCQHGEGNWWLGMLQVKWAIQAAARRRDDEDREAGRDDASWQAKGYRGGRCDPREFAIFDDEEAA
jgi:hypothetical protein